MQTQTTEATPSVATVVDSAPIEIPRSGTPEYAKWRVDGTLPTPKAAPAPADTSKETTTENAGEAESPQKTQEKQRARKPDAEHRIGELTRELKQLRADLDEARRPKETK